MNTMTPKISPAAFAVQFLDTQPHPKQVEFLQCRAPVKAACCGRRWGKSTAAGIDVVWFAVTHPGTTQFIIAPTADQASIIFDMAYQMTEGGLLRPLIKTVVRNPFPEMTLLVSDGSGGQTESRILARSAGNEGKYLRGHGADRVILDEAAYVPERVLGQVVPPMLASSQYGELVLISTPFGLNHFHNVFTRGQGDDPTVKSFHYPSHTNPHLSREYLDRQRADMTAMAFEVEYLAQFAEDQASVFRLSVITAALDMDMEVGAVLAEHSYVIGYDPAKWSDRSGLVVLDVTDTPYRVVEVLDIGGRDYMVQADAVERLARRYDDAPVLLDATSHDQMLEHLQTRGVQAEGYRFANISKQELVTGLVLALENRELKIPPHPELLRELQYYRFERTAAGNVRLGAPDRAGMHDDLVTALALALQQTGGQRDYVPGYEDDDLEWELEGLTEEEREQALTRREQIARTKRTLENFYRNAAYGFRDPDILSYDTRYVPGYGLYEADLPY